MNIFEWLKGRGYEYAWDVKLGGRAPDVVAFNKHEIIALEYKRDGINSAISHALQFLKEANKAYILTKISTHSSLAKRRGIGIIESNDSTKVILEAKHFPMEKEKFDRLIEKLKRKSLVGGDSNVKEKIVDVLRQNPDGLTIIGVAEALNTHRHTAAKYIAELLKEGTIVQRVIGPAKLCYLKTEKDGKHE